MRPRKKPSHRRGAPSVGGAGRAAASTAAAAARPADAAPLLSWAEVNRTHRIQSGVYQRRGRLVSLLTDFGRINPCYPDRQNEAGDKIYYTGDGRRGDQYLNPGNRALLDAIESGHGVPLFNKLAVGRWQHMGHWRVTHGRQFYSEEEKRMLWVFTLEKADDGGG
ncbi:MAG TPA: hypothetical protein VE842_08415 [Pyrinomonadaceae bacterium]|jgi:hypothetical protein|nr:hypothetical protein [Pyrinomonadaceae bacterium]